MIDVDRVRGRFEAVYGRAAEVGCRAPGRVNLIGEYTDLNEGFVLPFAIERGVACAAARRSDGVLRMASVQAPGAPVSVPIAELRPGRVDGWAAYPAGVAWAFGAAGVDLDGADLLVDGSLPLGSGLSSSAALEVAVGGALDALAGSGFLSADRAHLARLARRAENEFVGVPCGLMDQAAAVLCEDGRALLLDTQSLETTSVPFDVDADGLALLLIDTGVRRRLRDGGYATRRDECFAAAAALGLPSLRHAREVPTGDDVLARRARHVITENQRVLDVVARLDEGRLGEIGPLLTASHRSLRGDFEVTIPELDAAVDATLVAGGLGARMTGAGFGGSVIALVAADRVDAVVAEVVRVFDRAGFVPARFETVRPGPGARAWRG